jgi:hypothetical protein
MAPEALVVAALQAQAKRKGTSKLTMNQIDREIRAYRRERRLRSR